MSQTVSTSRALVRISVLSEGRRLDIGIPAQLPLIEVMPGFARSLGVLEATMTHAGYELRDADGRALDAGSTAAAQGIHDGDVLTLARGGLVAQPRVYDDIVEAVIDATEAQHRPWTPQDGAHTALAVSLTLLGVCALLLVAAGTAFTAGALTAAAGAVLLVAVAAVVARLGQPDAGHALGIAAAVFAALGGFLATSSAGLSPWGFPMAAAAASALVVGAGMTALMPERRQIQLGAVIAGAVVTVTALIAAAMPGGELAPYTVMAAVAATAGNALPWLVLSSTRIRVISAHTDAEVFADPQPVDADEVARRTAAGARGLLVARLALGVCILAATPLVAASGPAGAALCALAFVGTMFPARQTFARSHVMAIMTMGTVGLAVTGVVAALAQPQLRVPLLVALAVATAITVAVTLIAPRTRMRLSRLADAAELVILVTLLPLGVVAAGLA